MEERDAADDWIGEVHHQIDRTAIGNVHRIEPYGILYPTAIDRIHQEVDLMDVEWMHFFGRILDPPVLQRTDVHRQHGPGIHFEFLAIYIEALFVFREVNYEFRFGIFDSLKDRG